MLIRSELRDCLARVQNVLLRVERALGKLQLLPLLPRLEIDSFEHMDMWASATGRFY
jgi:hypothetical protein